jgi:hypothetical protein
LVVSGCASGKGESYARAGYDFSQIEKVAVIDVTGAIQGDAAKNQIADFFAMELLKRGYTPVERAQVQSILKEQDFQASDITSVENAAEAGRILNVPTALIVNIPEYDEDFSMTAKLVDVEDGGILWLGSGSGSTGKTLSTILGAAAGAAAGAAIAGDDSSDKVVGGIAGGVLGGVAGHALSPKEAEQAKKIINKVCDSLPYRFRKK